MNASIKENTIENPVNIYGTFGVTPQGVVTPIGQDTAASIQRQSYAINEKNIESISNGHSLIELSHPLSKMIRAFFRFGSGRINEQRLTSRDPWLEVYKIKRDL
jgi:hypothetical protein